MSAYVQPSNIFQYFCDAVDENLANELHPYAIVAALQYTAPSNKEHSKDFCCSCFKCRIHYLLVKTLLSKGYKDIIFISGNSNIIILS